MLTHLQARAWYDTHPLPWRRYLGIGTVGYVRLARHKETSEHYAVKVCSKGHLVQKKVQHTATLERELHMAKDSQFIVKLCSQLRILFGTFWNFLL